MNCQEFEDNIGAYALGALPEAEMREAQEHLRTCSQHPEAIEFQRVGVALAVGAPEMDPSPALKSRLMEAIRADAVPSPAAEPMKATKWQREGGASPGLLAMIRSWLTGPQRGYALSGALAVVVAALVIWNVSLQSGDTASGETVVTLTGAGTGRVIYLEDEQLAVMDVEGVEPLGTGQVYQVWAISDGQSASLGFLDVAEGGDATAAMSNISLDGVDSIAVTVEPTPGSQAPTSDPVIIGEV